MRAEIFMAVKNYTVDSFDGYSVIWSMAIEASEEFSAFIFGT
jgi:hypothetical protein